MRLAARAFRAIGGLPGFRALRSLGAKRKHAKILARHLENVHALASEDGARSPPVQGAGPLIAIVVPVFNSKASYLDDLSASFYRQPPGLCEFILSDDGSSARETRDWLSKHSNDQVITIIRSDVNRGIAAATNAGIARASAPWVGLVDHDDALDAFAIDRIARALAENPDCLFLYTDEIVADARLRPFEICLKPAWDPVLLSGVNYVSHLSLFRRSRLVELGGLRDGFQGSQDHELVLRFTRGLDAGQIRHLPYPAYLWRRGASHSVTFLKTAIDNARRALGERYSRPGRNVGVTAAAGGDDLHRVRFDEARSDWPRVSVVVPSRDALPLIGRVVDGLLESTDYPALEIVVVDNGSTDPGVLALYHDLARRAPGFRVSIEPGPFNFSRAVNRGVAMANGELVLLLNNDVEIVERGWLKEMVSCFDYDEVGIVGAKLLYPDRTLQHAGVIAGLGGYAGHWFVGQRDGFPGPMGRLRVRQSLSVVTGACMLVSKACLRRVGPFDETTFPVAYNDVDFCLRAVNSGFRVIWTPFACLVHHESASRGSDETEENVDRFNRDKANLRGRHRTDTLEDRAFNPWYSKGESVPHPICLDRLPKAR
jgi:O-antigen biosynthesis protein